MGPMVMSGTIIVVMSGTTGDERAMSGDHTIVIILSQSSLGGFVDCCDIIFNMRARSNLGHSKL